MDKIQCKHCGSFHNKFITSTVKGLEQYFCESCASTFVIKGKRYEN